MQFVLCTKCSVITPWATLTAPPASNPSYQEGHHHRHVPVEVICPAWKCMFFTLSSLLQKAGTCNPRASENTFTRKIAAVQEGSSLLHFKMLLMINSTFQQNFQKHPKKRGQSWGLLLCWEDVAWEPPRLYCTTKGLSKLWKWQPCEHR